MSRNVVHTISMAINECLCFDCFVSSIFISDKSFFFSSLLLCGTKALLTSHRIQHIPIRRRWKHRTKNRIVWWWVKLSKYVCTGSGWDKYKMFYLWWGSPCQWIKYQRIYSDKKSSKSHNWNDHTLILFVKLFGLLIKIHIISARWTFSLLFHRLWQLSMNYRLNNSTFG